MTNIDYFLSYPLPFVLFCVCGILIGMSKMGFPGINIITNAIFIYYFDIRTAISIALILLYIGDITAVIHYRKTFDKKLYFNFIMWALLGIVLSGIVGKFLDTKTLLISIASIVTLFALLMTIQHIRHIAGKKSQKNTETSSESSGVIHTDSHIGKTTRLQYFSNVFFGILSGISSMLANSSGPLTSMYLLTLNIPKKKFIGTGSFLYFTYNTVKFIIVIFLWQSLSFSLFSKVLLFFPTPILGAYLAKYLALKISEDIYRWVILLLVVISAIAIIIML